MDRSIGNPPYNANQENENDNNKNRKYTEVDKRVKATYVKESNAQKTKVYDMYSRFFRWASDRLGEDGILAFITNSSFVEARNFDGFRKVIESEFDGVYIIDLGGNVRENPKLSGTTHNVFSIQTGVAISFFIKKKSESNINQCKILYSRRPEHELATDKIDFLLRTPFQDISFQHLQSKKDGIWLRLENNNFETLIPLIDKESKNYREEFSIFKLFSSGVITARDEWIYSIQAANVEEKVKFFCTIYESEKNRYQKSKAKAQTNDFVDRSIKWTSELEHHLVRGTVVSFSIECVVDALHRPYVKRKLYYDRVVAHRIYQMPQIFPIRKRLENKLIAVNFGTPVFAALASGSITDYATLKFGNGSTQCLPLYRYEKNGDRIDNITDWGLTQFQTHYNDSTITKENIFHYTYAVLHHPAYRTKYELNLKREFPRLPFYPDFHQWTTWGKTLMDLHLNYETIEPHNLKRTEIATKPNPKAKLKADKTTGQIILDDNTELTGIPTIAWDYKLGNRSALEWILDQYKEKKPKDPTIREKFNTYKFADYKEHVIDLLQRVCTVSIQTMEIIQQMPDTVAHQKP